MLALAPTRKSQVGPGWRVLWTAHSSQEYLEELIAHHSCRELVGGSWCPCSPGGGTESVPTHCTLWVPHAVYP